MRNLCSIVLAGWLATGAVSATMAQSIKLMPEVSEVQWGDAVALQGDAVIVLSEQASLPEKEAGRMLAQYVEKRFGQRWAVVADKDAPRSAGLRVLLGERKSFPSLDRLCKEQKLVLPEHHEGYAMKVWSRNGQTTAIVAGNSGLGVIYGQDTLFQLLKKQGDKLILQAATIRDWPTIPLRGRPHPHYEYFFKAENFDCVMSSRFNFIDIRDGIYACEPGSVIKHDEIAPIITKARNLGLRVYAVVNCGIPVSQHDACIATFKEFLDMGCNGLWASFDDRGAGEDPVRMVERLIALGKEYGITGDAIATTPPKGDYQVIDTKFNRLIVKVPGMEKAVWYWTSIPGPEDSASGKKIGLEVEPSWWHNWPRRYHPSLSAGQGWAYHPVISLADGWNHPKDRELTEMGKYVHAIMPWDGWQMQQHYLIPVLGWWSWRPEKHDFNAVRRRIYDLVYGPDQVDNLMKFDDTLESVQNRFVYWVTHTESAPKCPPRLKSLKDRERTLADMKVLQETLRAIQAGGTVGSVVDPEVLKNEYLNPMEKEVKMGLAVTQAPFPEYWYPQYQAKILNAIYDDQTAEAAKLIAEVRGRILGEIEQIEKLVADPKAVENYAGWWKKRADATPADWKKLIQHRQANLADNIESYSSNVAPPRELLKNVNDPPIQIGTAIWERHNTLLATVLPEPRETFWGEWFGGIYDHEGTKAAVFAIERRERVNEGAHCEMPINIPLSGKRDRLALAIYVADVNKESFGLGRAKWRWAGCRALRLMWDEQELWQIDLGIPRFTGEWYVINLPTLPEDLTTLSLRLRVEDYWAAKNNLQIVYVGPVHLIELDREREDRK